MKKMFNRLVLVAATLSALMVFAATPMALAQTPKDAVCDGVALTGGSCTAPSSGPDVQSTITDVVNLLSFIVGIAAVIMIIIGGFKYITSTGDSAKVNSAKDTILYAIIGLVIVALAQAIVRFVLVRFTS